MPTGELSNRYLAGVERPMKGLDRHWDSVVRGGAAETKMGGSSTCPLVISDRHGSHAHLQVQLD